MNLELRFILGLEGVDDAEAAAIEAQLPAAVRLIQAMRALDPIIRKIMPDVQTMIPIVVARYPDLAAVLPVAEELAQLAKGT